MKKYLETALNIALPIWVGLNTLVAGVTVFSAYTGYIDQEYMPFAGIVGMTFPAWYLACIALLVADLFMCRKAAIAPAAALLVALKPMLVFSPLHFGNHSLTPEEQDRSFKVLSYNVLSFIDEQQPSNPETFNRTMHSILASGADVVALLEYENLGPVSKYVPKEQIDSLNELYPYFSRGGRGTVLYSKRPILHITPPEHLHSKGSIEAFRTNVADNPVNIFAVHLESIGLDDNDKRLYRELAKKGMMDNDSLSVSSIRSQLIGKLYGAFANRAKQAKMLRSYVEQLGGDAIVCGDFNDVPGCRTIKILEEIGMHDAYAKTAFGPCITFNAPHFFFRIDHVLWRGKMTAKKIERGNVPSSDHYPMLTTFVWDKDAYQRGTND